MAAPLWQAGGAIDPWAFGWMARRRAAWLAQPMRGAGQSASQPLCPSNAEWPRYLGDVFAEAADRYPIVGMIFESPCPLESPRGLAAPCLCERCRAEARARLDLDLEALARRAGPLDASALALCRDWARENARRVIEYLFLRCHKARRDMIFHFRLNDTPEAYALEDSAESTALRESQRHCETWLEEGAVDGVEIAGMPDDPEAFAEALERNLAVWPDDCLIYPVVRAATAEGFAALAAVMRERAVTGFVAEWVGPMTAETARTLAAGPLRAAAFISEREPIASVETLLEEVGMLSAADSGIAEFLRDLFRFTAHPEGMSPSEALAAAVENLRGLEARILQGQIDFGENAGMALLRLSQAKRLARLAANFSPA